jgi:hypothetical protein
MRCYSAQRLVAQRVHLLHLIHPSWARAPVLLLLLHTAGDLWPSAASNFVALHNTGGDLRPSLQDVHGHAAVNAPVLTLTRATLFQKKGIPHRWLLLPALDQGSRMRASSPSPPASGIAGYASRSP